MDVIATITKFIMSLIKVSVMGEWGGDGIYNLSWVSGTQVNETAITLDHSNNNIRP